jgi:hypothetical protein
MRMYTRYVVSFLVAVAVAGAVFFGRRVQGGAERGDISSLSFFLSPASFCGDACRRFASPLSSTYVRRSGQVS